MKNNHQKYIKQASLDLKLQFYQQSPKKSVIEQAENQIAVQNQEKIVLNEKVRIQTKIVDSPSGKRSRSRPSSKQKRADEDDQDEIFAQCLNLTQKIEILKQSKLESAVQQFQQEQRKRNDYVLQKQVQALKTKYEEKSKQLNQVKQQEKSKIIKALEQIRKFKQVYKTMLDEIKQRKSKIQREYTNSVAKVHENKNKLISQWKRSSNEQILKAIKSA